MQLKNRVLGPENLAAATSCDICSCFLTNFGVYPSLFLELSLAGLADRMLLLEIDAHICIKTRIKGVKIDWRSKYIYL